MANDIVKLSIVAELCRQLFKYRKVHAWPPIIVKGDVWDRVYEEQKGSLPVLNTVDEAVLWANELIEKIDNA